MKATVTADFLNVRNKPSLDSMVIGLLPGGAAIDVQDVQAGWAAVVLQAGGVALQTQKGQAITGFCASEWLDLPDNVVPTQNTFKLGLNALTNGELAMEEANAGCRFFLCMNNYAGAAEIKRAHPDAVVMVRRWLPQKVFISPEQAIEALEGATHKDLVYTLFNEADHGGQEGQALRERATIDLDVARRIKQISGATFAAGTFSMGTPDFTNDETCAIIRELYAPAYNSGLIAFDMHLYSPNPHHIDQPGEWQWFERRWEFLFTKCGFDPNIRAIYSSECGLDEGGVGGFKQHAYSQEQFLDWAEKYIALQSAPLVVDGVSYPSPIVGGAIFQLGGPDWDGYEMRGYLPSLRQFYRGIPAPATRGVDSAETMPKRKPATKPSAKGVPTKKPAKAKSSRKPAR